MIFLFKSVSVASPPDNVRYLLCLLLFSFPFPRQDDFLPTFLVIRDERKGKVGGGGEVGEVESGRERK